ncbi:aspartate aminotransferase family protein [soil metagenome]
MISTEVRTSGFRSPSSNSKVLSDRAKTVMPGGNSRLTVFQAPYPPYAVSGRGSVLVDAEGEERFDFINNYTSLLHGHTDPDITAAVIDQLQRGTAFALPTEQEIDLAAIIVDRYDAIEQVRFTNSGSEAVMMAIKAARAHTGKPALISFEGSYHGSYDAAEASLPPHANALEADPQPFAFSVGTPKGVLENVIVLPFNDVEAFEQAVEENKAILGAVLIDPMPLRIGMIPATEVFFKRIRQITKELGIVLIVDEVVNLRVAYGGMQSLYGVKADLTTMAKIIGGGFPVGAVGGSVEVMSVFDPTGKPKAPHGGTFNANPISMVAGAAAMSKFTEATLDRINGLGESLRVGLRKVFADAQVPAQITGMGSLFTILFHDRELSNYRSGMHSRTEQAMATAFYGEMLNNGIFMSSTLAGCLSTPMTQVEIDAFLGAAARSLEVVLDQK